VTYEFAWRPEADDAMNALEADPSMSSVVGAIERTLDRLEVDPFSPRLGTIPFQTPEFGGVCATPVRLDNWYIIGQRGSESHILDIILVHELDPGRGR
jgi:hypothetical protein